MKILVAGATGVLGVRAIPAMVKAGHDVIGVARSPGKRAVLERLGATAIEVDLFDAAAVHRAVRDVDVIINLATSVPSGFRVVFPWAWNAMSRIRREVSRNLVDAALAAPTVQRLIQESFAPVYAAAGDRWIDESFPVRPARYNRSVLDAEGNADRFTQSGRPAVTLRFGLLYGAGDALTRQMIDSVRRGWFPMFGRSESYSSWIAQDDAAAAVVAALGVPAGTYNVVESEPMRRRDLADGIARLLGTSPPRFLPSWATPFGGAVGPTLARSLRISNRKLRGASDWVPRYPTTLEGLASIITGIDG